ncbi:MAG: DUF21 domain-containing protein [Candidatus Cloacimonadaceae bacterium]|nr:DUF21 domain-containing protein [Candidatus Cloacimonadaceae bacterium]
MTVALMLWTLIMLIGFLSLSFLFSGFETGMISINIIALEQEAKRNKSKALLLDFIRKPEKLLGTTLIGNNIANVFLASLATFFAHRLHSPYFPAQYTSLLIGTLVLLFGEIMPKSLFRIMPIPWFLPYFLLSEQFILSYVPLLLGFPFSIPDCASCSK